MKKVLCMVLSLVMLLHCFAFATSVEDRVTAINQEEEFEKLVITAKKALDIDEEIYVFDTYSKRNSTLNLNWKSKDESKNGYISVTIDEQGDILSYSIDYNYDEKYKLNKIPSDDVLKYEAENFVKKVAPLKGKKFKAETVNMHLNSPTAGISLSRYETEICVNSSSCYVEINPVTNQVVYYNMNWHNVENFEDTNGILSPSDAIRAYKENLGYELLYKVYSDGKNVKSYLTYSPKFAYKNLISAKTGEVFTSAGYVVFGTTNDMASKEESITGGGLTKEEQIVYDELKNLPSKEEVISFVKSISEFNITDDFIEDNYSIYKGANEKYVATIRFKNGKTDYSMTKSVSLIIPDFEISSYNSYNYTDEKPKYKEDELRKKAEAFAQKYFADKINKCQRADDYENGIKYKRYENDIKVETDGISINMNNVTGEIESIWSTWNEIEFEKVIPQKSLDELYAKIINEDSFKLMYVLTPIDENGYSNYDKMHYNAHLVYMLNAHDSFDVNTLEPLNYKGEVMQKTSYEGHSDIDDHYIKEYADALGKVGIFYEDEKMHPDEIATQEDFVSLLAKMNGYNTDDISTFYKRTAERYFGGDVIDEDAPLKRIDAVRYAVNYKGYEDIAKIPSMFKTHFTDVQDDMVGYASLAAGLKIVSDKTDKLNGENYLTRAEALVIIFNLINN